MHSVLQVPFALFPDAHLAMEDAHLAMEEGGNIVCTLDLGIYHYTLITPSPPLG